METGRLRDAVSNAGLSPDAQDLLVDLVARHCTLFPKVSKPSDSSDKEKT